MFAINKTKYMKNKLVFILVAFIYLNTVKAQLSWMPLATAPKSWRLDDFHFINPKKGWAISPYYDYLTPNHWGQIWTTGDGGNSWKILKDSSKTFFRSIGFADSLTGWVGNLADSSITPDSTPLYHTTDGGVTWNPVTNIPNPQPKGICGISVVTDSVIYAYGRFYGPPVLLKTTNKGNTWTSTDMSPYASGLVDAWFFDKDTGFVTGCYGNYPSGQQMALILSTYDGGATWQVRHQSTRPGEEVWKISFPGRNIGYASIEYQNTPPSNIQTYYLKTTDGGITWTDIPFLPAGTWYDLEGIGFINDTVGWIGGDNCLPTYKTTNGGTTWNQDLSLGLDQDYITCNNSQAIAMNRFRRFGDTLMYGSGYTVCKLSKPVTPIPYFYANATTMCAGASVTFADSTINTYVTGWQWSFPGGTLASGSTLTDSMPVVIYNTPGTYAVTYTASNSAGSASITKTSYIHVLTSVAQINVAFSEGFEADSVPGSFWNVASSAGSNWMVTSTAAASGLKSVMINNISNTPGDTSKLISPTFDLTAIGSPSLTFAMAYQQKTTANTDKLQVEISTDCGESWLSKWAHTGASLQPQSVSGQSNSPFIPIPSQFTTYTVNLASVASSTNVMFRWVFYSGPSSVGNNIYLDNINIFNSTIGIQQYKDGSEQVNIYPNPNNGTFVIEPNSNTKHTVYVYDINGKLLLNQVIYGKTNIDASILNEGVYNINIISNEGVTNKRMVIVL
jgi:photosystem II stability/assembly factor-like uncharacterized protein